jgi:hypothetical protein
MDDNRIGLTGLCIILTNITQDSFWVLSKKTQGNSELQKKINWEKKIIFLLKL